MQITAYRETAGGMRGTWPIHPEELQLLKVGFILIQSRIYPFNLYATSNLGQLLNESPPSVLSLYKASAMSAAVLDFTVVQKAG